MLYVSHVLLVSFASTSEHELPLARRLIAHGVAILLSVHHMVAPIPEVPLELVLIELRTQALHLNQGYVDRSALWSLRGKDLFHRTQVVGFQGRL